MELITSNFDEAVVDACKDDALAGNAARPPDMPVDAPAQGSGVADDDPCDRSDEADSALAEAAAAAGFGGRDGHNSFRRERLSAFAATGLSLLTHGLLLGAALSFVGTARPAIRLVAGVPTADETAPAGDPAGLASRLSAATDPASAVPLPGDASAPQPQDPASLGGHDPAGDVAGWTPTPTDLSELHEPADDARPALGLTPPEPIPTPSPRDRVPPVLIGAGPAELAPQPPPPDTSNTSGIAPASSGQMTPPAPADSAPADPVSGLAGGGDAGPSQDSSLASDTGAVAAAAAAADSAFTPPKPVVPRGARTARGGSGRRRGDRRGYDDRGLPIPAYPALSQRLGESGLVVLEVEVTAAGAVGAVTVRTHPGHARLVEAAVAAVKKATFTPATHGGHPVAAVVSIPFRFVLK